GPMISDCQPGRDPGVQMQPAGSALSSQLFRPLPEELQMTALAALKCIPFNKESLVSRTHRAMPVPVKNDTTT
ncbi:MAG TPA: hypothetical protein PK640_14280, partial [Verrucomicrobiota bacterium]|nr:hypothetical protein [Verrucomicrobiota bacterium]